MKRTCWVLVSNHKTDRQALKTADQSFKISKQEQLCFPLELFIISEPKTKIMVLEMERHHSISDPNTTSTLKKRYTAQTSAIVYIRAYLQRTVMPEKINKNTVINGINSHWVWIKRMNKPALDKNLQSWHSALSTPDFLSKKDTTVRLPPYFRRNKENCSKQQSRQLIETLHIICVLPDVHSVFRHTSAYTVPGTNFFIQILAHVPD